MLRPAEYYSDDSDEFGEMDYYSNVAPTEYEEYEPSEEEKHANKLNNLYRAICCNDCEDVFKQLEDGVVGINDVVKDGWTPLLLAASMGSADLAIGLIKHGADINVHRDNLTVLMAAATCPASTARFEKSAEIIQHLIDLKANVNAKNRKRMNALMYAANTGNIQAVELLLPLTNTDDEDNQGWTALFWATNNNQFEIVDMLLKANLNPNKTDVRCLKPMDYAKQNGFGKIVELLPDDDPYKGIRVVQSSHYDFYEEIKRPKFMRDVYMMLIGMKCERLLEKFENVDLYQLLTMTEGSLIDMGITKPYQQNRILGGIYKFHKHAYMHKSIPIVPRNSVFTTIDTAKTMFAALRHLVTMQAAIKYLQLNVNSWEDKTASMVEQLTIIEERIGTMEKIALDLKRNTHQWDLENYPADLITPPQQPCNYFKWITALTLGSLLIYYKIKC